MDTVPVPRDIPLPLPAGALELEIILVFVFLLHILFVNLMLGGSLLTLFYEIRGLRRPVYDRLAQAVAKTVTVNKSLAVVLGVGPLLVINALYTIHFYSANALTGIAWIMIVPLVALAFLATYTHKYSWQLLAGRKGVHIAIGATASGILLMVPLIFLSNINLMLFPERWLEVKGFLSALVLPNVLPRYLHFLTASVALTGLFLMAYMGRQGYPASDEIGEFDHARLRAEFAAVVFAATGLQALFGPLLLLTLPPQGVRWVMLLNILLGISLAVAAMVLLWREIRRPAAALGFRYLATVVLLTGTVIFMAYGRHLYREGAVAPHRALINEATLRHQTAVLGAQMREATGTLRIGEVEASASPGERVFRAVCMACHARDERRVGPPLTEIVDVYAGNPEGFIEWVKKPGKKRPDYPDMPPIRMRDDQHRAVATYVLEEVFAEPAPADPAAAEPSSY